MRPRVRLFEVSLASVALSVFPGCLAGHYEPTPAVDCERVPSTPSLRGPDNLQIDSEGLVVMLDRRGRAVDAVVAQG